MVVRKARLEVNAIEGTPASVFFVSTNHSLELRCTRVRFGVLSRTIKTQSPYHHALHYSHRNGHDAAFIFSRRLIISKSRFNVG